MKTFYTVYQITNLITNQIYVGTHRTKNPNDDYKGSGTRLINSIKKYGIENFQKDILFIFETSEEMFQKEAEIVDEEFLKRDDTLNIRIGGLGGFDHINVENRIITKETRKKLSDLNKGKTIPQDVRDKISKTLQGRKATPQEIENMKKAYRENGHPWDGRKHSEESKEKMSLSSIGKLHTKETKRKMSISKKGNTNAVRHKVSIEGTVYNTIKEASLKLDIKYPTVQYRIKSKSFPEYIKLEEYT